MTHADRNRRRKAKLRRIAGRANRTKTGSARAQRRARLVRRAARPVVDVAALIKTAEAVVAHIEANPEVSPQPAEVIA